MEHDIGVKTRSIEVFEYNIKKEKEQRVTTRKSVYKSVKSFRRYGNVKASSDFDIPLCTVLTFRSFVQAIRAKIDLCLFFSCEV